MTINKALSLAYRVRFLGNEPPWTAGQAALGRVLLMMLVASRLAACTNGQPAEYPGGEQCPEGAPCTTEQEVFTSTACSNGTVEPGKQCEEGNITAGEMREVVQLAAGYAHTCALLEGGAVRCWGDGSEAKLGYGHTESIGDDETPAAAGNVPLGGSAIQLAAGAVHTCALLEDGAVRCWGYNDSGNLGYGHSKRSGGDDTPAAAGDVPLGGSAIQLAAGYAHTCALLDSGSVRCWGWNGEGQLGYGNTQSIGDNEPPASAGDVLLGGTATQLAAGFRHTCALLDSGAVRCWGAGGAGQLGYGSTESIGDDEPPVSAGDVPLGGSAIQLAASWEHTCALLEGGAVRCWGSGSEGQLGYGNTEPIGDNETPASAGDVPLGGSAIQLAAGFGHTCAVLDSGAVRCWGAGGAGQLGYGNTESIGDDETPASAGDVPLGGSAIQLAAGSSHTCAVLDSGAVRCWGSASDGQLGYGNTESIGDNETPASAGDVPIFFVVQVIDLAAGDRHTCALLNTGAIRCWGQSEYGQLGHGNTVTIGDDELPVSAGDVPLGGSATQLAAGRYHTCALLEGGAVRCWGAGGAGQLGYGNTESIGDDETPALAGDVPLGGSAIQLAAGRYHTCALLEGGAVRCWGAGGAGQLGYGNTESIGDNETPASRGDVPLGGNATRLATGSYHTCAVLEGGAVRCWGCGGAGQLGYGNTESIGDNETLASTGDVPLGGSAIQLAAGRYHTCALLEGGAVRCWGSGSEGQLGYGNTEPIGDNETPASAGDVPLGGSATQLAAGSYHMCAVLEGGAVRCWGSGGDGRLGYGNTVTIGDDETPASAGDVALGGSAMKLAAGDRHTCALLDSSAVACWGANYAGQLGYGTTVTIGDDETLVSRGDVPLGGSAIELAAGGNHTCALLDTGAVRCWGQSEYGQLGYGEPWHTGSIGDDETPASAGDVPLGGSASQLAAGYAHTCALLDSGAVRCWGYNDYGQLGHGNTVMIGDDETPASAGDVPLGGSAIQLAAGWEHTCALLDTGAVRCWGGNSYGQLGYGNTQDIGDDETPASAGDVPLGGSATQLAAGAVHTCALLDSGAVRCWGYNDYGQLGYGNTVMIGDDETPASAGDVLVGGRAIQLAAGAVHTCAVLDRGAVRCWGYGGDGRLGYGNTVMIGDDETPASAGDVPLGGSAIQISAGREHTCAVLDRGAVRCWGDNDEGQLGYGNLVMIGDDETPASAGDVPLGGRAIQLAAGTADHTCALLDRGAVRCWGVNYSGQLGYGHTKLIGDNETPASASGVPILGNVPQEELELTALR